MPDAALHTFGELRAYTGIPKDEVLPEDLARNLIHGYYACVSYTDAQVGKLLNELEQLGLSEDTIVVLWGDHGWNLGDHTLWCKHCCFESSMRATLMMRAPGIEGGRPTDAITEFIDIYPTLCELAGLPLPGHLEGKSFVPVLKNPDASVKDMAIGRFGKGDTIRTDRYRYAAYRDAKDNPLGCMLFDHAADPDEMANIAPRPEQSTLVERLHGTLRANMGK